MRALALVSDAFGGHGGIALYNRNVLTALCRYGAGSEVVALPRLVERTPEALPPALDYKQEAQGSKVAYLTAATKTLARQRQFDLVVASHLNLLPIAEIARRISKAKLVLFVYGFDAWKPRKPLATAALRNVDRVVSIRQHTIDRLLQWAPLHGTPCRVLENAIHLELYGHGPRRRDLVQRYGLDGKCVLMTLGRIASPRFGFDEIVEVLPDLVRERPNLTYLAVGGGSDLPRLQRKVEQLGIGDHVVFTGQIPEEEKRDHYRLADAFAMPGSHPTDYDRYPLRFVFLEAMACGLPVVASRPEELGLNGNGPIPNIYVDPRDREDLKRGLRLALDRGPGPVPRELKWYDYANFEKRLHAIIDETLAQTRT